jgi:L-2-hydroxyglutarate oxidase LhgO
VAVAEKLAILLKGRFKGDVLSDHEVLSVTQSGKSVEVTTSRGTFTAGYLVACAGLQCDRLAVAAGAHPGMEIVGFRGDYFDLSPRGASKVRNLIYPVPDSRFPFLGVHFTRMIHGGVECGPNAVFSFKREGYGKTDFSLRDTIEALTYGGTWKLFAKHWRYGLEEYRRAFSKRLFLKSLRKLIPSLEMEDLQPGRAGVRAVALDPDGGLIDDFKIVRDGRVIHVLNAPSPAATACLAIGAEIERLAAESFSL